MNCAEAMEALLEADLEDVARERDTELARHLERCGQCGSAADRILTVERELGRAVQDARPRMPVEAALHEARQRARARRRFDALRRALVPLAAAAGIAAVMLFRGAMPGPAPSGEPLGRTTAPVAFDVGVATDRNVIVFESTSRPDIVVVWFY